MNLLEEFKGRLIVTSGKNYIDIDAYASCIVYAKILSKLGINAISVTNAEMNESIPKKMFGNTNLMLNTYKYQNGDKFVIIDISNKKYFDTFVKEEDIIQIIDHHYGFKEYWKNILKEEAIIEPIGAVATIIVEFAIKTGYIKEMPKNEILLLMAAILDNTLNFKAKITSNRDKIAYQRLLEKIQEEKFEEKYFIACQDIIENDLEYYIKLATKCEKTSENLPSIFSQLVVWNKDKIFLKINKIQQELNKIGEEWVLNLIVLKDEKSYIICNNDISKRKLESLFNSKFEGDILSLDYVVLRKEIIKKAYQCEIKE